MKKEESPIIEMLNNPEFYKFMLMWIIGVPTLLFLYERVIVERDFAIIILLCLYILPLLVAGYVLYLIIKKLLK